MWDLLRPKYPPKIQKPKYLTKKLKKQNKKHPLQARQGYTKHVCKTSESNSQKRRGHWHMKEVWVLCLNHPVNICRGPCALTSKHVSSMMEGFLSCRWCSYTCSYFTILSPMMKVSRKGTNLRSYCASVYPSMHPYFAHLSTSSVVLQTTTLPGSVVLLLL